MGVPTATSRLQVRAGFDLHAAADVCDYVATLGAGAAYLSPLLPSVRGSDHGYDVVGFDTVDAARGGVDGWTRLLAAARARGLRIVVDIVPNHTGVADATQNQAWWDLLRLGRNSPYASWFDIDWTRGKVLLPVLGDDFEPSELEAFPEGELRYYEHRFPLAPGTEPAPGESAVAVHERQHYELVNYRRADTEQNYRRFFAVTGLAGLRVEDEDVFTATHEQITRWLRDDEIDGVRIDHPDGLTDPLGYLVRLRALAPDDTWITVEKILEPGEELPDEWPVDGTTGYDALAEVGGLFVDPSGETAFDDLYRELTADTADFAEHVARGKRQAVTTILQAEVSRLARLAPGTGLSPGGYSPAGYAPISGGTPTPTAGGTPSPGGYASTAGGTPIVEALNELLVAFPVYRSYLPEGAQYLATAIEKARTARPDLADSIGTLSARLADPADELAVRFQQTCGAVMAKGVEDTTYYRYTRLIALNEVGGDPAQFGLGPADFHAAQCRRQRGAPHSMTTLSTHDTKRGEDIRARLAVLSELPDEWAALVRQLMAAAPVPDPTFGYLLWQTFVGAGFIERERMHAYAEKAMREAAQCTTWIDPDVAFEATVHAAVDAAYDSTTIRDPLTAFIDRITPYGWTNSLAQKLVQLTMPGVPDVYQGTELWEDSLVDPDNRRAVDFDARRALLDTLDGDVEPPPIDESGAAKLWVVSRTLRLRRDWPDLFSGYDAAPVEGTAAQHAVAFDRGGCITVATRMPVRLERDGGWRDTT
ncbi:MAG: malto-oligosyltrehalose synthase, partial [Pseudonocardiales bacterium]